MTHDQIVELAGKWIKNHKQNILVPNCKTVALDLKTVEQEKPDVLAWNSSLSVMIEVKISRSDFLCDFKKPFRVNPELGVGELRYYCCPYGLIKETEIPEKWGLLYVCDGKIEIIKVAQKQVANLKAERNILISINRRKK